MPKDPDLEAAIESYRRAERKETAIKLAKYLRENGNLPYMEVERLFGIKPRTFKLILEENTSILTTDRSNDRRIVVIARDIDGELRRRESEERDLRNKAIKLLNIMKQESILV